MIHLSQSRSSIIFEKDGDSLSILYWGKKIGVLDAGSEKAINVALTKARLTVVLIRLLEI